MPRFLLLTVLLLATVTPAQAGFYFWDNPGGGSWEDPGNWIGIGYPSLFFDFAVFDADATMAVDATDPATVERIALLAVDGGHVALSTHDAFEANVRVGLTAPATLVLETGRIGSSDAVSVGSFGSLVLGSGTGITAAGGSGTGLSVSTGGSLYGNGAFVETPSLRCQGTLSPGTGPGTTGALDLRITTAGGLDLRPECQLLLEIAGASDYDRISHTSPSPLMAGGNLTIAFVGGYLPSGGERFDLVAGEVTGSFASLALPTVDGLTLELVQDGTGLALEVGGALPPPIAASLDIKPDDCPNAFNPKSRGSLPVALSLAGDLDVHDIDISSLRLEGAPALSHGYGDVTSPVEDGCACEARGPDGSQDLLLKFSSEAIAEALGELEAGDTPTLTLTGAFLDGSEFSTGDCVRIVGNQRKRGRSDRESAWNTPLDLRIESATDPGRIAVAFALPEAGPVRVDVFDISGRRIASLVNDSRNAGHHDITWQPSGTPNGVYFLKLESANGTRTARVTLVD